jgi:hypothetical protein
MLSLVHIKHLLLHVCHSYFTVLYEMHSGTFLQTIKESFKVPNILSTAINQHTSYKTLRCFHRLFRMDAFFCTHYSCVPHIFQKIWSQFKNPSVRKVTQRSSWPQFYELPECPSTQDLKISVVWRSPHQKLQVTLIPGDTWKTQSICVLEGVHIDIHTVIIKKIKHDIQSVSKCDTKSRCILVCLAERYIQSLETGQDYVHTCSREGQGFCTTRLVSFTQKIMQKLMAKHIRDKKLEESVVKGCSQQGILSPMLCCLVINVSQKDSKGLALICSLSQKYPESKY